MTDDKDKLDSSPLLKDETMSFIYGTLISRRKEAALSAATQALSDNTKNLMHKQYELLVQLHDDEWNRVTEVRFSGQENLTDEQVIEVEKTINNPQRLADALTEKIQIWEKLYDQEQNEAEKGEIALAIDAGRALESQFLNEALRSEYQTKS